MKKAFLSLFILCFQLNGICQYKISGTWQGLITKESTNSEQAQAIYFKLSCIGSLISGESREEKENTEEFCTKLINGKISDGKSSKSIELTQISIIKKVGMANETCLLNFTLKYNDSSGYFEGSYSSTKCPGQQGKVILYKSIIEFHQNAKPLIPHTWITRFKSDLLLGLSSIEQRKKELNSFVFETVYFGYNSDSIPFKYYSYLNKMSRVILGHSDLRIKIMGNTDSDGSDKFNEDLSLRRAKSLTKYFVSRGLKPDRIIIEYHGEKQPVGSNKTPEGRQKNRRVNFEFI